MVDEHGFVCSWKWSIILHSIFQKKGTVKKMKESKDLRIVPPLLEYDMSSNAYYLFWFIC